MSFVNGKPTEWNLISEMGTCRESAAACFSLTKVIEPPAQTPDRGAGDTGADTSVQRKKKKKKDAVVEEMSENPLHDGEDEGDMENPLHEGADDEEEL